MSKSLKLSKWELSAGNDTERGGNWKEKAQNQCKSEKKTPESINNG